MVATLFRSLLLVSFAVLAMRLMGKRQIGQLQPFELVIAIMIADLASTPMESLDTPLWRGVMPLLTTVALHQLFSYLSPAASSHPRRWARPLWKPAAN